jgi:YNFM family putative membrane transporter
VGSVDLSAHTTDLAGTADTEDVADLADAALAAGVGGVTEAAHGGASRRWRTLIAMLVGISALFSNIYATQPILPTLSREFDIAPTVSALTVSVVVLGMGVASLVYGPLSDRTGRKPVIVVTACLLLLPTLGAALAPDFSTLLICRALQGLLIPGTTAVGLAYLQEVLPPSWRGVSTSVYVSATALGGLVGRLQGAFLTDALGWRWAFGSFVATAGLSAALLVVWLPRQRRPRPALRRFRRLRAAGQLGLTYLRVGRFFGQRRVLGGALIGCTMFLAFVGVFTYLPYRMEQPPFNFSESQISLLYAIYLAGFIVTPWTGPLSDRLGRRGVIGASLVLMIAGALFTLQDSLEYIIAGLVLLNIGLLAAHAAASAFVNDHAPATSRGSATSFYLVWYYLGGTLGPAVAGLAWQGYAWPGVLGVCLAAVGLSFAALLTLCG